MRSRYKETAENKAEAYLVYGEHLFSACDAVDALRFAKASDVISYTDNTHVITDYRYDSFGRRTHTVERTKWGMRTIYDGLSFEVVKEGETTPDSRGITTTGSGDANLYNYNPHGSDHTRGTRYYFISEREHELRTDKNGTALPDRTKGVRTYLYLNGERVAVNNLYNTNHGQYYYGSDILGSVRFITGQAGQELNRIEYDIFGGIYKGASPYGLETGYTGKPYDSVTGLSDYGFRDYSPAYARFMTEDPIRDGENWFAYVGNNPVNWVDPWGLETVITMTYTKNTETLLVEVWDDNKPNRPVRTETYTATNNPQPMDYPRGQTIPLEKPYYAQPYPNGTWEVKSVSHPNNKDFGQTKINTNAGQYIQTYKQSNGIWKPDGKTWDSGYQIHGGGYSGDPLGENNVNDNTYGCIRMKNADVNKLGESLEKHLNNNVPITLKVQDKEPPKKQITPQGENIQTKEKKNK